MLSYAHKRRSPGIEIDGFLSFLNRYATHYAPERPEWRKWSGDTISRFWVELNPLVEAGKCELHTEGAQGKVLMLEYYAEVINKVYDNLEAQASLPFPDERTLGLSIPPGQLRSVSVDLELEQYMKDPLTADMPVIRIDFPENQGAALFLARHIPDRALEASLIKLQYYIQSQNNKDYFAARLSTQLQGKYVLIKEVLNQLEAKPYECLSHIKDAGEFASLFWPYLGAAVKLELKKKNEFTSAELGAVQSIYLIEFFVTYFRARTAQEKERELALREIESRLDKPPYFFTYKDIVGFTDLSGRLLVEAYGQNNLDELLKEKSTRISDSAGAGTALPEMLIFRNIIDEQVFINKSKVFPLTAKLLGDVRAQVRKALSARWTKKLRDFQSEAAMENDRDFERVLTNYAFQASSNLGMLLRDQKVYLVQAELERSQGGLLQYTRLFDDHGKLLPMSTLLLMNRRELLADIKILLPFWYSIPIISAIIGFFKRLKARKDDVEEEPEQEFEEPRPKPRSGDMVSLDLLLKRAATQFLSEKVPAGQTVDHYMATLEKRWRKILDREAHRQMAQDVQALIKKKLQRMMAIRTGKRAGVQPITEMADAILFETPSLMDLDSTEAMKLYIALYISKLLKNL
jgi:hypothetical protein